MTVKTIEAQPAEKKKLRVAAYCRVSTDNDDQRESLETQKAHYEAWIRLHSEWECAGIFYDFGITGTKADVRDGLQALLYECRIGRIDYVLTKSVSRFSRNTTDCLELVRELLSYNVPIYFEKEKLDTGSMETELVLAILSSLAQEESASISKNVKWGNQKRIKNGRYRAGTAPYGYTFDRKPSFRRTHKRTFRRKQTLSASFSSPLFLVWVCIRSARNWTEGVCRHAGAASGVPQRSWAF